MKSLFSKVLPFVFLAMLSIAPIHAQAASNFGPSGPSEGMFDCLGSLDWGCRIVGFLFDSTDNTVTYVKNGNTVVDTPTPAINALRGLMGFFSNALLIVASIILLYHLIQMVAESAQTGEVGGKSTNKLWAPIRLVIAIGLLVPLDTGLNSGQYIVMQIAKWGSGLASQGWKVFVTKLSENDTLSLPVTPHVLKVSENIFKTYACQRIISYYAEKANLTDEIVMKRNTTISGYTKVIFGNNINNDVCGDLVFKSPTFNISNLANAGDTLKLTKINDDEFIKADPSIQQEAYDFADPIIDKSTTLPTTANLIKVQQSYQTSLENALKNSGINQSAMQKILADVQNAANTRGWTSAGSWFLSITRAQGEIITGGLNIPEASGPNKNVLCGGNYVDACETYGRFEKQYDTGKRASTSGTTPTPNLLSVEKEASEVNAFTKYATGAGGLTIDTLLGYLDSIASGIELWTNDPAKAFGDLGGSRNPFGEIAALGQKKIRLALDYLGLAILTGGVGGVASFVMSLGGPWTAGAGAIVGGLTAGAVTLIMMVATLFMLAGVLLAFIVPLFPFTRFFFAIVTWLGSVMEAMILVPFMALGFLTPNGEGFSGPNTRNAYFSIFQVFLRPILSIFGLIAAMIMFYIAAKFLNAMFYEATAGMGTYQNSGMKFVQKLVYSVAYVGLIYTAANVSFKMIEHIPQHALGWMGGSAKEHSYDDHNAYMGIAGAAASQQLISQFNNIPNLVTSPLKSVTDGISGTRKQQIADAKDKSGTAGTNDRHQQQLAATNRSANQGLLAAGGQLRPGKSMEDSDAVQMPSEQQQIAVDEKRNEVAADMKEANRLENDINSEVSQYSANPTANAGMLATIQANSNRYAMLTGRQHPAVGSIPLPSPTVLPPIGRIDQNLAELENLKRIT